jgi:hypothetical protein
MLSRWYYTRADGQTDGPVSARRLRQMASAGRLHPGDRLRMDGKAKTVLAGDIEGLFPPPPREPGGRASD